MKEKYTQKFESDCAILSATKNAAAEKSPTRNFLNPAPLGVEVDPIPAPREALRPTCPDPDKGFQPFSKYQRKRITKRVMHHMKELCRARGITLDLAYWEQQTMFILAPQSTENILVISSPAGSGKSTWIEAFACTFVELLQTEVEIASSLVGIVVVLQKIEDLNRLAGVLNSDSPQDNPNMVSLQGWSQSGKRLGFCQNPGVDTFEECRPNSCPHAQTCGLLTFRKQAPMAPIIGLTQERFGMLRESGGLDSVLYRLDKDGHSRPRRYLIFDEKFQMAQINTLDKPCIDRASIEFSKLIEKIDASDSQVRSLQQRLSYHVDRPFQELRRSLCIETDQGNRDIQAGFCTLSASYLDSDRQFAFQHFSDFVLCQRRQYATKHLRTALSVMSSLYGGQQCPFSKTNGYSITSIFPPPLQYGESQSIIFDATAEIDEDYRCLQNAKFSKGLPQRKQSCLKFHVYTHGDLNVSKRTMSNAWKISALSQLIASLIANAHNNEDVFLCTYKDYAEELAKRLKEAMSPECFRHIRLMPDREPDTIPYFGGTNGSNVFNTATTVMMLGFPRLNPRDYLIHACAAYGNDRLSAELARIPTEELISKHSNCIWNLPSIKGYMAHHLAARMEQEIYRCKLRNPDFYGEINVYFFRPPTDMMEILCDRLAPNDIVYHDELPTCIEVCKQSSRRYENGPTSYGRLVQFLATWDGKEISVQQLRSDLKISASVWKDLLDEERVKYLLAQHQVQRKGRGPNAAWYKDSRELCA